MLLGLGSAGQSLSLADLRHPTFHPHRAICTAQLPRTLDAMNNGSTLHGRLELVAALLLALAAVTTAWAAFQSTKWSGVQADSYSQASAARVESTRASTEAGQLTVIDVGTFTSWVAALSAEQRAGAPTGLSPDGAYTPQPGTESGFLFTRFRDEFRPAVEAWLATRPLADPAAPRTPFAMPEYHLDANDRSAELEQRAEELVAQARAANQNGDNYVLMTIMFALVLLFAGISTNLDNPRAQQVLVTGAAFAFVVAAVIVATFPKQL